MTTAEHNALFNTWLSEHAGVLHHIANGFAVGADRHDLMQELLLALWRAVPAFRQSARPSTFIFRVAHNAALTWKRSQRNYERRLEQFEMVAAGGGNEGIGDGEREAAALAWLYVAIRELPALDRSLVLLQLEGLSYAEIAEIHGLAESNVGARLSRLKQKLTESMKE